MKARNLDRFPSLVARYQENSGTGLLSLRYLFQAISGENRIIGFLREFLTLRFNRDLCLSRKVFNLHQRNSIASRKIAVFGDLEDANLLAFGIEQVKFNGQIVVSTK
jgi:hypothetical protein